MQMALLGFDFFEAVAAGGGFGTRDFAAYIVGGAGVQRPDGGFVEAVVGALVPAHYRDVRFGDPRSAVAV